MLNNILMVCSILFIGLVIVALGYFLYTKIKELFQNNRYTLASRTYNSKCIHREACRTYAKRYRRILSYRKDGCEVGWCDCYDDGEKNDVW